MTLVTYFSGHEFQCIQLCKIFYCSSQLWSCSFYSSESRMGWFLKLNLSCIFNTNPLVVFVLLYIYRINLMLFCWDFSCPFSWGIYALSSHLSHCLYPAWDLVDAGCERRLRQWYFLPFVRHCIDFLCYPSMLDLQVKPRAAATIWGQDLNDTFN